MLNWREYLMSCLSRLQMNSLEIYIIGMPHMECGIPVKVRKAEHMELERIN